MKKTVNIFAAVGFLPLALVYFEIMLRIFGDIGFQGSALPIVFALSTGLAAAAVLSLLPPKACRVCTGAALFITGLYFASQAIVNRNFDAYMSPASMLAGVRGVVTQYRENLLAAVAMGIPQILLFLAPGIFYSVFVGRLPIAPKDRAGLICTAASLACSVGIFAAGLLLTDKDIRGDSDFDRRTRMLGLICSLEMNIRGDISPAKEASGFIYDRQYENDEPSLGLSGAVTETSAPVISPDIKPSAPVTLGKSEGISRKTQPVNNIQPEDKPVTSPAEKPKPVTLGASGNTLPLKPEKPAPIPPKIPTDEEKAAIAASGSNVMALDFDGAYARTKNSVTADLNAYVQSLSPSGKNLYTGLFKGKNLILICAEAFSDAAVDEQLTPTLYRMTRNGIYFSNYYQPTWGGSTTTGEFSFVTGLVPESGLESMQKISHNNNYFTLGNQLQRQGYASGAFHNGNYDYYSRNLTHRNLGYTDFLAFGNGLENITRKYSEDSAMIDKTVDLYLDRQPFSLYYMTVSGHFSYKADNVKVKENLPRVKEVFGDRYMDKTCYYFCYQMELDKAMEMLIAKLEAAGASNNTVICITADHYPYGLENNSSYGNTADYVSDLYGYKHSSPWEKDRNSWILWSGCLENELSDFACEISSPTYSLDIVPTLSNLFGLEFDSRLLVGRDVFSDTPPLALWNNLSWISERGRYNSKTKEFTPADGYVYDSDYVKSINNIVKNKIYFSKQVVNTDYYGALFGDDDVT